MLSRALGKSAVFINGKKAANGASVSTRKQSGGPKQQDAFVRFILAVCYNLSDKKLKISVKSGLRPLNGNMQGKSRAGTRYGFVTRVN